jgi:hypothetical protein
MSSNTFGDGLMAPFNSEWVPNLDSPVGELDLDWYTDLQGWGLGFEPVAYFFGKWTWTVGRKLRGKPAVNWMPWMDPGERTAMLESMNGGYRDIFTTQYMSQACPQ